jgi:hypothetical protein
MLAMQDAEQSMTASQVSDEIFFVFKFRNQFFSIFNRVTFSVKLVQQKQNAAPHTVTNIQTNAIAIIDAW